MKQILKNSQKNEVFDLIQKTGLDPKNFIWSIKKESILELSNLSYKNSDYFFQFGYFLPDRVFHPIWSPGKQKYQEGIFAQSWLEVKIKVREWLETIKIELGEPDKWKQIEESELLPLLDNAYWNANNLFTKEENKYINSKLDELSVFFINQLNLEKHQFDYLSKQIEYIANASKRLGRKDWMLLCIGILTNIILTLSLKSITITQIIHKFKLLFFEINKYLQ